MAFHTSPPAPRIQVRPVDPNWACLRSGDCCRSVESVVMTQQEARVVMEIAQSRLTIGQLNRVHWSPTSHVGFVSLQAAPCPFLEGQNTCLVHDVRPFNCRRFGCLRPDPTAEPLVMAPASSWLQYGRVGCSNLRERLIQSRVARRLYARLQRKGQRWARAHGWTEEQP